MKKKLEFPNFGKLVKTARKERRVNQASLAEKLGYTTAQFISNVERGLAAYPLNKFKLVSKTLRIDLSEMTDIFIKDEIVRMEREIKGA